MQEKKSSFHISNPSLPLMFSISKANAPFSCCKSTSDTQPATEDLCSGTVFFFLHSNSSISPWISPAQCSRSLEPPRCTRLCPARLLPWSLRFPGTAQHSLAKLSKRLWKAGRKTYLNTTMFTPLLPLSPQASCNSSALWIKLVIDNKCNYAINSFPVILVF